MIQDLLLPEERIHQADYLIDLSRDRIQVYNVRTLKKANLAGLHTHFDDYYDDFVYDGIDGLPFQDDDEWVNDGIDGLPFQGDDKLVNDRIDGLPF